MLLRSSNIVLPMAVDVGSSGVRVLQLQRGGDQLFVRAAGKIDFPANFDSETERWECAVEGIRELLKDNDFSGRQAVTIVPNHAVHFKSFRIPPMPDDELEQAVAFEAEERFAFQCDDAEYRFIEAEEVRHGQEVRKEIIAMGCKGDDLRRHLNIFDKLGLVCTAMDVAPCAIVRCFEHDIDGSQVPGRARIYADLGRQATRIVITMNGKIIFIKTITVGAKRLDELTAVKLNLSLGEASQLRRELVKYQNQSESESASEPQTQIVKSAIAVTRTMMEELGKEISLCLRYYAVTFRGVRPEELVCVGGQSYDQKLLQVIFEVAGVQTVDHCPLANIDTTRVFSEAQRQGKLHEWATATGLSLRNYSNGSVKKVAS